MRYLLILIMYASALVFIYSAVQIDPNLKFPVSEWTMLQWIAADMLTLGMMLKLAGHALLLRIV